MKLKDACFGRKNNVQTEAMKLKDACFGRKNNVQTREHIKNQRHYFANKVPYSHTMVFQQL